MATKGPTDAAREVGCGPDFARYSLRGALARGCYEVPPVHSMPRAELGRRCVATRRGNAALREEVRASAARCLGLAAQARALAEELRSALDVGDCD